MSRQRTAVYLMALVLLGVSFALRAAGVSEEAQRHFDRGMAAVEMAQTPQDYQLAIEEFKQAQALAPDWPDVYYNLGLVQDKAGNYRDAAKSLRRYLQLAPNAPDAAQVRSLANKDEFKAEQAISGDDVLDIFSSLGAFDMPVASDLRGGQWQLRGMTSEDSTKSGIFKGLKLSSGQGRQIAVSYWETPDELSRSQRAHTQQVSPQGKMIDFQTVYYLCSASVQRDRCPVYYWYRLEIVSKRLVKMHVKTATPRIQNMDGQVYDSHYEFTKR